MSIGNNIDVWRCKCVAGDVLRCVSFKNSSVLCHTSAKIECFTLHVCWCEALHQIPRFDDFAMHGYIVSPISLFEERKVVFYLIPQSEFASNSFTTRFSHAFSHHSIAHEDLHRLCK